MTEQPAPPPPGVGPADPPKPADSAHEDTTSAPPRRQPGEPHPYMLQRNPPNLWILVALTIFSLALTIIILVMTVLL